MRRLVLTGGGTGGHIYPALALAEAFLAADPARELLFVGSKRGLESRIVPEAGLPFKALQSRGWRGKGLGQRLLFLGDLAGGSLGALKALRRFRPDAVLATGSFASLPVLGAARLLGLPIFLQEQNSVPGRVIRLFAPRARAVFLAYAEAARWLRVDPDCLLETGNPLRASLVALAQERQGSRPPGRRLMIFGGSRGARSLNLAAREALPRLADEFEFEAVVQTGEADFPALNEALAPLAPRVRVKSYIENMPEEMARSHWIISRSGAMTLAEVTLLGLPAVLVPFPHAVDDHQTRNAQTLVDAGAARLIPDACLGGELLANTLAELWRDPELEARMALASRALGRPRATQDILEHMEKSLAGPLGR